MVYSWANHETACFNLYVEEGRPLDEVMQIMKEKYDFDPSKRAYQQQFKRWDFPTKHHPVHQNEELVQRIRQLWERNTSQKEMLRTLKAEGFEVSDRGMMRVRSKHGWLLRVPNGGKSYGAGEPPIKRKVETYQDDVAQHEQKDQTTLSLETAFAGEQPSGGNVETEDPSFDERPSSEVPPEIGEKRKARLENMQVKSDELYANKKRRRRTRGWAGLPADPPAAPRFPSETTLDESKAFLHMDNEQYRNVRDHFQSIFEATGFLKKTAAGPESWQAAKTQLIAENAHLNKQFSGLLDGVSAESKSLALDVVCTDVTKRMRTIGRRITIAEAKNICGINPAQSREVRTQFYNILIGDHFTGKLDVSDEHWKALRRTWIEGSRILQDVLAWGETDPQYEEKLKAINILSRDVMKRLRDDQNKIDPSGKKQLNLGPGPGPAGPRFVKHPEDDNNRSSNQDALRDMRSPSISASTAAKRHRAPAQPRSARARSRAIPAHSKNDEAQEQQQRYDNAQIDPTLLAAAETTFADQLQRYTASADSASADQAYNRPYAPATQASPLAHSRPAHLQQAQRVSASAVPVWFRSSHTSTVTCGLPGEPWIAMLQHNSIHDVRQTATKGMQGARVGKAWGVVERDGQETLMMLRSDGELGAYMSFLRDQDSSANPIFVVEIVAA